MFTVISWQCECGIKLKAIYETKGMTTIHCPKSSCKFTHIVDGGITELWIKDDSGSKDWRRQKLSSFVEAIPAARPGRMGYFLAAGMPEAARRRLS